jgi:hypothetical protein
MQTSGRGQNSRRERIASGPLTYQAESPAQARPLHLLTRLLEQKRRPTLYFFPLASHLYAPIASNPGKPNVEKVAAAKPVRAVPEQACLQRQRAANLRAVAERAQQLRGGSAAGACHHGGVACWGALAETRQSAARLAFHETRRFTLRNSAHRFGNLRNAASHFG